MRYFLYCLSLLVWTTSCTHTNSFEVPQRDYISPEVLMRPLSPENTEVRLARAALVGDTAVVIQPLLGGAFLGSDKSCFTVATEANAPSHADLAHFSVYRESDGMLVPLPAVQPTPHPEPKVSRGNGAGSYAETKHTSESLFCSEEKIDFARGITLYVKADNQPGIAPEDFVWTTDPEDPSSDTLVTQEWKSKRRTEIQTKFSKLTF